MRVNKSPRFKSITGCRPAQLFGLWCIEPSRFQAMYAQAMRIDLVELGRIRAARRSDSPSAPLPSERPDVDDDSMDEFPMSDDGDGDEDGYAVSNGIAQIGLTGPLSKYTTSFQSLFGGTSTVAARRAIRLADEDDSVDGIMLYIDSPGGTVAGTADLADAIADTGKPTYAYVSDLGASGAYWCASQADKIFCNATGGVGCIGVVMALEDTSKAYEQAGVKVHVVSTGGMKGAGTDGAPVTDEQIAYFQGLADDTNDLFARAIAAGRGMSIDQAKSLADGRIHIGAKAQSAGLIDGVTSYADAMQALYGESQQSRRTRRDAMWFGGSKSV